MSDLIDRQAAIAYAISGRIRTLPTSEDGENWIRVEEVRESLLNMPSAQPTQTNTSNTLNALDCISRQTAIDAIEDTDWYHQNKNKDMVHGANSSEHQAWYKAEDVYKALENVPSAQQWIPIKTRPMTEDERHYFEEQVGVELSDDEAVIFDCPMPDDGQRVWVQSVNGYIWDDTCDRDDFIGLEGNGDWDTIVAWMPMIIPEQYKGIEDGKRK